MVDDGADAPWDIVHCSISSLDIFYTKKRIDSFVAQSRNIDDLNIVDRRARRAHEVDCQLNWVDHRYMDAVDHDFDNDVDTTNLTSSVYSPLVLASWPDWHTFRMLFSYTLKEKIISYW